MPQSTDRVEALHALTTQLHTAATVPYKNHCLLSPPYSMNLEPDFPFPSELDTNACFSVTLPFCWEFQDRGSTNDFWGRMLLFGSTFGSGGPDNGKSFSRHSEFQSCTCAWSPLIPNRCPTLDLSAPISENSAEVPVPELFKLKQQDAFPHLGLGLWRQQDAFPHLGLGLWRQQDPHLLSCHTNSPSHWPDGEKNTCCLSLRTFSSCSANVTRNIKLYICVCVDMQSQCVLCEIPMQMLFTSVVSKETMSSVTSYILCHEVQKVSLILWLKYQPDVWPQRPSHSLQWRGEGWEVSGGDTSR